MNRLEACLLCGSESTRPLDPHTVFGLPSKIVECEDCRFAFSTHQLDDAELYEFYSQRYRRQKQEALDEDRILGDLERSVSQLEFLGRHLAPSDRVLEIGGGWGINANFLHGRGYRDIVVDEFDDQIMRVLHPNIRRISLPVSDIDERFDLVFMSHVLEHFFEPVPKLRHLARLLGPAGRLFIEVPNCANAQLMRSSRRTFHYWFFDQRHVENLLKQSGYQIVRSSCYGKNQRISDLDPSQKRALAERVKRGETTMRPMREDDPRALWVRVLAQVCGTET